MRLVLALMAFVAPTLVAAQGGGVSGQDPSVFREQPNIAQPLHPGEYYDVSCRAVTGLQTGNGRYTFFCDDGSAEPFAVRSPRFMDLVEGEPADAAASACRDDYTLDGISSVVQTFVLLKAIKPSTTAQLKLSVKQSRTTNLPIDLVAMEARIDLW